MPTPVLALVLTGLGHCLPSSAPVPVLPRGRLAALGGGRSLPTRGEPGPPFLGWWGQHGASAREPK